MWGEADPSAFYPFDRIVISPLLEADGKPTEWVYLAGVRAGVTYSVVALLRLLLERTEERTWTIARRPTKATIRAAIEFLLDEGHAIHLVANSRLAAQQ